MELLVPIIAAIAFFATLGLIVMQARGIHDVIFLYVMTAMVFYGLRIFFISTGLDTPSPNSVFSAVLDTTLFAKTTVWLVAYNAMFLLGIVLVRRGRSGGSGGLPFARIRPTNARYDTAVIGLTALATVVSMVMLARYGGIGGLITASKLEKSLSGLNFLRIPAATGAFVSVGALIDVSRDLRHSSSARTRVAVYAACSILNAFFVFIWGARSALVLIGIVLLVGWSARTGAVKLSRSQALKRTGVVMIAGLVIVATASFGLRVARDTATKGELDPNVARSSVARKVSLATNSVFFDATMLGVRDFPSANDFRGGEDFAIGASGAVPRLLWPGKPAHVTVGRGFRQIYQPKIVNGWPLGAPGDWYINFGGLGMLVGGLLSGAVVGALSRRQNRSPVTGLNVAVATVTMFYVLSGGISSESVRGAAFSLVPLLLVIAFLTYPGRRSTFVAVPDHHEFDPLERTVSS